jgi:short subunit dehydrogenase-like uncharacterized protein
MTTSLSIGAHVTSVSMTMRDWLLYGANGYTGRLIADEAVRRGLRPILAGRRADAVRPLAEQLGLPWRAFPLDDAGAVAAQLDGVAAVLHAAGPFSATSAVVVEACLRSGASYLDITGELAVFEAVHARGAEAAARGCVLLPGVGFDVVPTDCLAATLKAALPSATHLELAWAAISRGVEIPFSQGTAKSIIEGMPDGGAVREGGRIVRVPLAWRTREVPFPTGKLHAMSVPWGDVSTAYHSTGIPNIVVYTALPRGAVIGFRLLRPMLPLLRAGRVQRSLKRLVDKTVKGPDAEARSVGRSVFWGHVHDGAGRARAATLDVPFEGYALTALTAVESAERVVAGAVAPGAHTPSTAFGADFIRVVPGVTLALVDE